MTEPRTTDPVVFSGKTAAWFDSVPDVRTLPALGPVLPSRAHGRDERGSVPTVRRSAGLDGSLARRFRGDETGRA